MYLIKSGMNELDLHGDLVIKVSTFDVDEVLEHKQHIVEGLSEKIDVEILVDQQLEKNECIIETNMGSIDCSLGTQMEALLQELRLIRESLEGDGFNA
jgi:flagellar biosynthesis/type III secretory pathway protein FliH